MSVDFTAEFDLGAAFEGPERLREQLAAEPPGLRETVERFRHRWLVKEWTVQACRARPAFPEVVGPGGFAITLSPVVARLYHVTRFSTFATEADERALLRRSCSVIAGRLGSSRALVMPESTSTGFFDGLDLVAIEAGMRRDVGPPRRAGRSCAPPSRTDRAPGTSRPSPMSDKTPLERRRSMAARPSPDAARRRLGGPPLRLTEG